MNLVIYISGRYSGDVQANTAAAVAVGRQLRAAGFVPLVPHLATLPMDDPGSPAGYRRAMRECLALVRIADAMFLARGWEKSPGAQREVEFARALAKPIFIRLTALGQWASRKALEEAAE